MTQVSTHRRRMGEKLRDSLNSPKGAEPLSYNANNYLGIRTGSSPTPLLQASTNTQKATPSVA